MPNAPLKHIHGSTVTTVIDPRFGTGTAPTQPVGWGGTSGGGASHIYELVGPHADWGLAVNEALASNRYVRIAADLGDIPLRTEIVIPSNRTLEMGTGTRFSVTDDHVQPTVLSLPRRAHYAMIRPDGTPTTYAENIVIRGVNIDGSQAAPRIPDPVGTYFGIGIVYARNVLVEDSVCTSLQRNGQSTNPGCYGIGASMAENVQFVRCKGWDNGYQNLTVYDGGRHIDFIDCYSGPGWRTGFQIHRDTSDIRVINLTVRQADPAANSCVTIHGYPGSADAQRITFIGLDIESTQVNMSLEDRGGMQIEGGVRDLLILGGRIRSVNYGLYLLGVNIRVIGVDISSARPALKVGGNTLPKGEVSVVGCRLVSTEAGQPAVHLAATSAYSRFRVSDCDISANGGTGIQLDSAASPSKVMLTGNRIETSGTGMALAGAGVAYGNDLTGTAGVTGGSGFTTGT